MKNRPVLSLSLIAALVFTLLSFSAFSSAANSYQINNTLSATATTSESSLDVNTLKYEPYPVSPGEWFDLWIKVQNMGEADAPHAIFQIVSDYPFTSNESLVKDIGALPGTVNAYKMGMDKDANQVVLKYRIKVADNAPEGISKLKFRKTADASKGTSIQEEIPIMIGKTQTDFDVMMQEITPQGTSFVVTNTGQNLAHSVLLTIKQQSDITTLGPPSAVIGDLDKGDFIISHIKVLPKDTTKQLTLDISYTDISGVRSTIEKNVTVNMPQKLETICKTNTNSDYLKWVYGAGGAFIGIILVIIIMILDSRKAKKVKAHE